MPAMTAIARILYRLTLPGGLLLVAAIIVLQVGGLADSASKLQFVPAALAVAGLLLSAVFRRSRLFFAMLILTAAQASLSWIVPYLAAATGKTLVNAIALLVPINLVALAFEQERGIISPAGRRRFALLGLEIILVGAICLPQLAQSAIWLDRAFFPGQFLAWSRLAQPELVVFVAALAVMTGLLIRRYQPVDSGLLWALVASFVALEMGPGTYQAAIFFSSGGLAIIVALLETSYKMAYHDELTQLPSRRALNEDLMKLPASYTIAMVDVDHFKKFNDTYGHESGDQALRLVASRLARVTGGGRSYRYGGEEFAIVFPGKAAEEVVVYLEGLRRLIEQSAFVVRGKERRNGKKGRLRSAKEAKTETSVTVSIGVASTGDERTAPADVMRAADQALYRAKAKGRNCTVSVRAKKGAASVQSGVRAISAG